MANKSKTKENKKNKEGKKIKRVQRGELLKKVLLAAGKGLTVGTILLFPPISGSLFVIFEICQELEGKMINRKKVKRVLKDLEKKNYLSIQETRNDWLITFKKKGKRLLLRYKLDELKIKKPKKWDQKWRLVIFDIPQNKRNARDILRRKIKLLGFYHLHRSVFVHPFECQQEIEWLISYYELEEYVYFIRADYIGNQSTILKKFDLS